MKRVIGYAAIAPLALVLLTHAGWLSALFSANYLPHRYCYLAQPGLVWTNVTMDGLIAASYGLLFGCLFWISHQLRREQALESYLWIFIAFGTFIVACGATHLMEVVTVWWPVYPLSAAVKVLCAAASVPTAILFARVSPPLASNILRFLDMLSTTQQEKEQAVIALVASEKLATAGRISASIAHEIKNPLNSIGDLMYLLAQDQRVPADLLALIETAKSELKRADGTAQATLALFHGSNAPIAVEFSSLVQSALELQTSSLLKDQISLSTRVRTPLPLTAYPGELQQVLINLIQNAAAAIGSGGRIHLRIQPRHSLAGDSPTAQASWPIGSRVTRLFGKPGYSITVADDGPGIELASRARLFTLFFTTKGDQGTGLGLWLVRSMVEKQGGRITFRSRAAGESSRSGTLFNIWIPLEPASLPSALLGQEDACGANGRLHPLAS